MNVIENMLRQVIGLDAASIGSSSIERIVRLRMKGLGLKRHEEYHRLVQSSSQEWNELVEAVVVTETWFFRDREPFLAFAKLARDEWLPAHPTGILRILSVPCASGEEPYSLAMALMDAGFPPDRFQVEGIDISQRALDRAARGVYGKNSFRGKDLAFRQRYFHQTDEGHMLHAAVRRNVFLHRGNLLGDDFTTGSAAYDFVFCRNLLIYFDRVTQGKVFERLHRALGPSGTLFVGPAEVPLATEHGFTTAGIPMAFACRRTSETTLRPHVRAPQPIRSAKLPPAPVLLPRQVSREEFLHDGGLRSVAKTASSPVPAVDLVAARRLADEGKLDQAAEICHAHLRFHGASAHAYYLLGLVSDAHGLVQASDYYRKALYLDPDHWEALWQLAMLAQKNGDAARARTFKRRAQRAQQKHRVNHEQS